MYRLRIIILFDFMMFRIKGECANVCWFMVVKNLLESPFSFELFVLHLSFGMMAPILPGKHRMNLALPLILLLNTKYTKWLTEESWSVNKKKKIKKLDWSSTANCEVKLPLTILCLTGHSEYDLSRLYKLNWCFGFVFSPFCSQCFVFLLRVQLALHSKSQPNCDFY